MSQRIQIQLESSLAELRDYEQRQIFSLSEIAAIVKQRTHYEQAITRRDVQENDYWEYYQYQSRLEDLRLLRTKREKRQRKGKSIADWALQKANVTLLRRAIRRFPKSTRFWPALLSLLKAANPPSYHTISRAYMGYIAAAPTESIRWIEASQYEFEEGDVQVARKLLMRAVRLLPRDEKLWHAWIDLEIEYADRLKKRWTVLGVLGQSDGQEDLDGEDVDNAADVDGMPVSEKLDRDVGETQERNAVIEGAVVKVVITHALDHLSSADLAAYPALIQQLRNRKTTLAPSLLAHVYEHLGEKHAGEALALSLEAERPFHTAPTSIDALSQTVKAYFQLCKTSSEPLVWTKFIEFLAQQARTGDNPALVQYVRANIRKLYTLNLARQSAQSVSFTATYLIALGSLMEPEAAEALQAAKTSLERHPQSVEVAIHTVRLLHHAAVVLEEGRRIAKPLLRRFPHSRSLFEAYVEYESPASSSLLLDLVKQTLASSESPSKPDVLSFLFDSLVESSVEDQGLSKLAGEALVPLSSWRKARDQAAPADRRRLHGIVCAHPDATLADQAAYLRLLLWEAKDVQEAQAQFKRLQRSGRYPGLEAAWVDIGTVPR